jgi:phosphonoacetaldehyde hydrolase
VLAPRAAELGYVPDCIVCPDDVPAGRPFPWMCYTNSIQLGVFPMESMVKVGDTVVDVEEGLNAGMWTVGISLTGNLSGRSEVEVDALPIDERKEICRIAEMKLLQTGAHRVIEGIWELPGVLDEINAAISLGARP